MESTVRKRLGDALLRDLSKKENTKTRKQLSGGRPQLLYLENLEFINDIIRILVEKGRIPKSIKVLEFTEKDLETARTIAKKYQNSYVKRKKYYQTGANDIENTIGGRHLKAKFPAEYKKVVAGKAFMVSSFDQLRLCKVEIIGKFVKTTEKNLKKITSRVDRGHGGGDGVAVSGVQAAKAFGRVDNVLETKEEKDQFAKDFKLFLDNALDEGELDPQIYNDLIRIQLKYDQIVTSTGKLSATYIPFITFQDKYTNRVTDRAREVEVKKLIGKFFNKIKTGELTSMEGSSSLEDKATSVVVAKLSNIKGAKLNISPKIDPKKTKLRTGGKPTSKTSSKRGGGFTKRKGARAIPTGRTSKAKQSSTSIANILGILNQRLPTRVAENMGSPRLNMRTGRFAGSVRAVDVNITRQGYPSIGYTYQRDPYEVFEASSGTRFSDRVRDPRSLIDYSIRQIAAEMAIGTLYTRRV